MKETDIRIFFDTWWGIISRFEGTLIDEVEGGLRDKLNRNNYSMVSSFYNITQEFLRVQEVQDILSLCKEEKIRELNNSEDLTKKIVGAIAELKKYEPVFSSLDKIDRGIFIPFLPSDNFIRDGEVPARLVESGLFEAVAENGRLFVRQAPYLNLALKIGLDQTCSAPYIVGSCNMFSGLVENVRRVFEFGVGCGYQIANYGVMHEKAELFGVDYFEHLCKLAQGNISRMDDLSGLDISGRLKIKQGRWSNNNDKFFEENAPYDVISFGFMLPFGFDLTILAEYLGDEGIIIAPVCDRINGRVDPTIGFLNLVYKEENKVSSAKVASVWFVATIED